MECIMQVIAATETELTTMLLLLIERINSQQDAENELFVSAALLAKEHHIRIDNYVEEWIAKYIEEDFFSLFRMTRQTFFTLLNEIDSEDFHKRYQGGGELVPIDKQLLMTLWWLGKGETLLSLSDRFNVALSTVFNCTTVILEKIIGLREKYIVWPNYEEAETIKNKFERRSGYPGEYVDVNEKVNEHCRSL